MNIYVPQFLNSAGIKELNQKKKKKDDSSLSSFIAAILSCSHCCCCKDVKAALSLMTFVTSLCRYWSPFISRSIIYASVAVIVRAGNRDVVVLSPWTPCLSDELMKALEVRGQRSGWLVSIEWDIWVTSWGNFFRMWLKFWWVKVKGQVSVISQHTQDPEVLVRKPTDSKRSLRLKNHETLVMRGQKVNCSRLPHSLWINVLRQTGI